MDTGIVPGDTGSPEGVSGNPGEDMGLMGQVREHTSPQGAGALPIEPATWGERKRRGGNGKERKASRVAAPLPHGLVRIGLGKGGAPFLPSPSPFPFSYSMWEVESY